ncbi:MAG: response regulator [Alphaproteobacteria bacterium]|nr:response regulator [Alphaproteobacteria bacterium]
MRKSNKHQGKAGGKKAQANHLPANKVSLDEPSGFPVVGIGASAGGLEACKKLVAGLPANSGMAFILIQHLEPTHESMMVDLLSGHTSTTVQQAADGMLIEPDHFYVIPPGRYLSVEQGALRLSQPKDRHGARLPFDFLLQSLAKECGQRAICVILSGTGSDGSIGLKAVKENSGFVIAQSPDEAGYDGMPRSAIATGMVDIVLEASKIPEALMKHAHGQDLGPPLIGQTPSTDEGTWLREIVEILRAQATQDFTLYKTGTLQRRIERRMAMRGINAEEKKRYIDVLKTDADEVQLLAKDLLINVTNFFRDQSVFDYLAEKILPDLIRNHVTDQPLRIWIAGCSSGEESYSHAMLIQEQIEAQNSNVKLQVFASDVDEDAVITAREGLYPESIEADVSPDRLARFFIKEGNGYRVAPDLRSSVVFTVQDVLADPPFSRLDMISCRNLLIYLSPEAQAKVISLFHFALVKGGLLLLGNSETIGNNTDRFEVISKTERLYRHIGPSRHGGFSPALDSNVRVPVRSSHSLTQSRQAYLAETCRRMVLENYAPAAVLTNLKHECLYSLGPTDRYLRVAPGHLTNNLLAMVRHGMSSKLASAVLRANQEKTRITVDGGQIRNNGSSVSFSIAVQPVPNDGEELLLICFIDQPSKEAKRAAHAQPGESSRVAELEDELKEIKEELRLTTRDLEISSEEQKAINEEALSVNEEFQSTNEELLASKEELQSLNEELTALNSQLQETLERQRTLSNDLQNVLYSTDVATLFLDAGLHIRFFTPATRSIFSVIPGDIGRPLVDLHSLAADNLLPNDAREVLRAQAPIEREIEGQGGAWYVRRISPYRTQDGLIEGVVITFTDVTERRRILEALNVAKRQADLANEAKSRFLAAASHDIRQPLQTLTLLQGLLEKEVKGEDARKLVSRLDETLSAMSGILNTLLDISRIEAGNVLPEMADFPINDLLMKLSDEFSYLAHAQGLELRVQPCKVLVHSDHALLEQMIRNLLSNALKFTRNGKVLLGCRRHCGMLSIEVWDTGIGIPESELQAIFDEYHQLDNQARERRLGLGLGLSIVQRLGNLLGNRIRVRSQKGKGSMFAIEVMTSAALLKTAKTAAQSVNGVAGDEQAQSKGKILIVEDDSEMRDLLELTLSHCGHRTASAHDGLGALELVTQKNFRPDIVLTDLRLPSDMNGIQIGAKLRELLNQDVPVIILTGDTSAETLRDIHRHDFVRLSKPVKVKEMTCLIQRLLANPKTMACKTALPPAKPARESKRPVVFIVDDDTHIRQTLRSDLEERGLAVQDYDSAEAFIEAYRPGQMGCLLIDAYLPGISGFELLKHMKDAGHSLPSIMITGYSDVPMAIRAMKAGALDFIEKPVSRAALRDGIERALMMSEDANIISDWRENAENSLAMLTKRERQILDMVLAGQPSKNIAADLGISQRTVENHRASIMKKTDTKSLPALARLAFIAAPPQRENASLKHSGIAE